MTCSPRKPAFGLRFCASSGFPRAPPDLLSMGGQMATHDLSAHAHHTDEGLHNRSGERRTQWVVLLTFAMMVGELIVGFMTGSVALKADGWHMGTHVGALGFTL